MYSKRWSISKSSTFYLFIITRSRSNLNSSVKDKSSNIHHITATTISKSPNAIYISIILSNRIPCFLFLEVIQIEIGLHHLCEGQKTVMISRFQNSFFILISSSSTIFLQNQQYRYQMHGNTLPKHATLFSSFQFTSTMNSATFQLLPPYHLAVQIIIVGQMVRYLFIKYSS